MGMYTRGLPALVLGAAAIASPLASQENIGTGAFRWYFGAYAGAPVRTRRSRNAVFSGRWQLDRVARYSDALSCSFIGGMTRGTERYAC